jgi:hypothetical protein
MTDGKARFLKGHGRAVLASIALTVGFVFVMHAGALPVLPARGILDGVLPWPALGFLVGLLVSMLTKYARFYFLLAPVARIPMRRIMSISCIAMALITLLPFRLGELARPAMLRERGRVSGWAITAAVGAERIIDGVVFGLALLLGLAVAPPHDPVPDHIGGLPVPAALVPRAAVAATTVFGVSLLIMAVFYWRRQWARSLTDRLVGAFSRPLAAKLTDVIERTSSGLRFLTDLRHAGPYLAVTAISTLTNIWAVDLLAVSFHLPGIHFAESAVILGVLAIGFALPNAPGFFGAVQLALYAGLALYVSPELVTAQGSGFVFVYYIAYLGVVLSLAVGAWVLEYAVGKGSGAPGVLIEREP